MRKILFSGFASVVLLVFLAVTGCQLGGVNGGSGSGSGNGDTVSTQDYAQQSDGSYLYKTNDAANEGQTFYYYADSTTGAAGFTFEVVVSKASGKAGGGFGLIFQRQDSSNFWFVNVDVQGAYSLGKVSGGNVTYLTTQNDQSWVSCSFLRQGYGIANTLKVIYDASATSPYSFWVNGTQIQTFSDTVGTVYTTGNLGFDVGVFSTEEFPGTPVSVSFAVNSPAGLSFPSLNLSVSRMLEGQR